MFFQVYGENAFYQFLGFFLAFTGLILFNEFARCTPTTGFISFIGIPILVTIYLFLVNVCAKLGFSWALNNSTYIRMNGWFHYAKLYAANIGSLGFVLIKYKMWIGKHDWFKPWPFVIVAINILIAVASDFESAIKGARSLALTGERWWLSSEGIWLYGGWWNVLNGVAGILDIFCMTDWWGIYSSTDKKDMLWPDMTWQFILAYDLWNFEYTYCNLTTHTWYCGLALLLAPTFANQFWNKGGWIQNRANTLSIWCMFAQLFPEFLDNSIFSVVPSLYKGYINKLVKRGEKPTAVDPSAQGFIAILSITSNICVICTIFKRWIKKKRNPYTNPIFNDTDDFVEAYKRIGPEEIKDKEGYEKLINYDDDTEEKPKEVIEQKLIVN